MERNYVIIGNPENRRVELFQKALIGLGKKPAYVLAYEEIFRLNLNISHLVDDNSIVRIESPGENFNVEREIIALGYESGCIGKEEARRLKNEKGRIYYPSRWYTGFTNLQKSIFELDGNVTGIKWMNNPIDIITMFNKPICQKLLCDNKVRVPRSLGNVTGYDDLRCKMEISSVTRVFVKLFCSSSASGICAYQYNPKSGKQILISTMEICQRDGKNAFYNSLNIKRYTESNKIKIILDWICSQGAQVEEWIPKETVDGYAFDLRVLVVGKKAAHMVPRLSKSPMTNLHLGNRRGDIDKLGLTKGEIDDALVEALKAAELFPNSHYKGIDVLISSGSHKPYIVDVNAFGDLLPGISFNGMDTYTFEICEFEKNS